MNEVQDIETHKIDLLHYNKQVDGMETYYFANVQVFDFLHFFPSNFAVKSFEFFAQKDDAFLTIEDMEEQNILLDLLLFLKKHDEYEFVSFELTFQNDIQINAHDNYEVTVNFPENSRHRILIYDFFGNCWFRTYFYGRASFPREREIHSSGRIYGFGSGL